MVILEKVYQEQEHGTRYFFDSKNLLFLSEVLGSKPNRSLREIKKQ